MKGTTLVEFMIALTISSVLMITCFQVFFSIQKMSMTQHALAVIQENARTLHILLGEAIRENGKIGCNALKEEVSLKNHTRVNLDYYGFSPQYNPLGITENNLRKNPYVATSVLQRVVPGNSILWLKGVSKPRNLKTQKLIVISDCEAIDVVENIYSKQEVQLSKQYTEGSEMAILSSKIFYIGNTKRIHPNGDPVLALYVTDLNDRTLELIENVEALEITYGLSAKNTQTLYEPLENIDDWQKVNSIRAVVTFSGNNKLVLKDWIFEWSIQSYS